MLKVEESCEYDDSPNENRRSTRKPNECFLNKPDVISLLTKVRSNHTDTVVLKLKDHVSSDINCAVLDEIITALKQNRVCQALYAQNLTHAMKDNQLIHLTNLLKKKKIWCLNLGENYDISNSGWQLFCDELPQTNVTHLYVSEHVISAKLKNDMRFHIRENRKKHNKHSSVRNLKVISKCTNMWW
jgi:hypothetical protein